jgi:hypothetical protein
VHRIIQDFEKATDINRIVALRLISLDVREIPTRPPREMFEYGPSATT